MPAFALLLLWPLVEIALFVVVGGAIGLWLTFFVVISTGVAGVYLLQRLGLRNAGHLRSEMGRMRDPLGAAGDGALKALAALLLILPGFLTDFLGVVLLIPPVRGALISALAQRIGAASMRSDQPARRSDGIVIDGEFVEVEHKEAGAAPPRSGPPSGWTRH